MSSCLLLPASLPATHGLVIAGPSLSPWPPFHMLQVFTTAASDESPQIVRLAFDTVEKIVREHFHYITGK